MFIAVSRNSMINVRLADQTHEDFKTVAELRGASMSTLLHQFIVKAIREEKEISPKSFVPKIQVKHVKDEKLTSIQPDTKTKKDKAA